MGHIAKQEAQAEDCGARPDALGQPVAGQSLDREVTGDDEPQRDGGVLVGAAHVPGRIDHGRDNEAKDEPDADMGDLAARQAISHNGPTSREHQGERAKALGDARGQLWSGAVDRRDLVC